MTQQLHDPGEEYIMDKLDGETLTVLLFDDSTDALTDAESVGDITTEPAGAGYSRQTSAFSSGDFSGDWGLDNDAAVTFDLSDSTGTIDSYAVCVSFQSDDQGDGSPTLNIIWTGALTQSYTIDDLNQFEITAGGCRLTLD